jgi:hypothetical protein
MPLSRIFFLKYVPEKRKQKADWGVIFSNFLSKDIGQVLALITEPKPFSQEMFSTRFCKRPNQLQLHSNLPPASVPFFTLIILWYAQLSSERVISLFKKRN